MFADYSSRLCRVKKTSTLLITLQATDAERRQALSTFKQRRSAPERADFVLKIRTVELHAGQNAVASDEKEAFCTSSSGDSSDDAQETQQILRELNGKQIAALNCCMHVLFARYRRASDI